MDLPPCRGARRRRTELDVSVLALRSVLRAGMTGGAPRSEWLRTELPIRSPWEERA